MRTYINININKVFSHSGSGSEELMLKLQSLNLVKTQMFYDLSFQRNKPLDTSKLTKQTILEEPHSTVHMTLLFTHDDYNIEIKH